MRYFGYWTTNSCKSFIEEPILGTNKFSVLKKIRKIAIANRIQGATASWIVLEEDPITKTRCKVIFAGCYKLHVGTRYTIYNGKSIRHSKENEK